MKKILIIAWSFFPAVGGMPEESYLLAKEFISRGFDVDVLTEKRALDSPTFEKHDQINIFRTGFVENRNLLSFLKMMQEITLFSVRNSRKYNLAIIRGAFTFEPLFVGFLKFLGIFRCKTWVTADTGGSSDEIILLKKWKLSRMFIFFAKHHDYYNSICEANATHYRELGFDKNKMTFIKNGIKIPSRPVKDIVKIKNFLFLGRLEEIKGIRELLDEFSEVLKQFPKTKLIIGGEGSLREYLLNFIKTRRLERRIIYKGLITRNERDNFFNLGDCLVLPSHSEGYPLVVFEALLRGKHVIATDVGDLRKDLNGVIDFFDIDYKGRLSSKMCSLIGKQVKRNSLDRISENVDIRKTADQILELI